MSERKSTTEQVKPGAVFGRWTLIAPEHAHGPSRRWECRCECGTTKFVTISNFRSGKSASCGCFRHEYLLARNTIHGQTPRGGRSSEYNVWACMKARCDAAKGRDHANYAGRGIRVCDRWANSFEAFYEDMGPKPSPRHQIDRIDNDGNYEPGNCRWATPSENVRNRRCTVYLELNGVRRLQCDWAKIVGLSQATLCERRAAGWTDEEVLTRPATPGKKHA